MARPSFSKSAFALVALALVSTLAAGCSSSSSSTGVPPAPLTSVVQTHACAWLTPAIAASALGIPQKDGDEQNPAPIVSTCSYAFADASKLPVVSKSITLLVRSYTTDAEATTAFESAKGTIYQNFNVQPTDVSGVGDEAFLIGAPVYQLDVRTGSTWLLLSVHGVADDTGTLSTVMSQLLQAAH